MSSVDLPARACAATALAFCTSLSSLSTAIDAAEALALVLVEAGKSDSSIWSSSESSRYTSAKVFARPGGIHCKHVNISSTRVSSWCSSSSGSCSSSNGSSAH